MANGFALTFGLWLIDWALQKWLHLPRAPLPSTLSLSLSLSAILALACCSCIIHEADTEATTKNLRRCITCSYLLADCDTSANDNKQRGEECARGSKQEVCEWEAGARTVFVRVCVQKACQVVAYKIYARLANVVRLSGEKGLHTHTAHKFLLCGKDGRNSPAHSLLCYKACVAAFWAHSAMKCQMAEERCRRQVMKQSAFAKWTDRVRGDAEQQQPQQHQQRDGCLPFFLPSSVPSCAERGRVLLENKFISVSRWRMDDGCLGLDGTGSVI